MHGYDWKDSCNLMENKKINITVHFEGERFRIERDSAISFAHC